MIFELSFDVLNVSLHRTNDFADVLDGRSRARNFRIVDPMVLVDSIVSFLRPRTGPSKLPPEVRTQHTGPRVASKDTIE